METKRPGKVVAYIMIGILLIAGAILFYFGFKNNQEVVFMSSEDNKINYKVFLKQNDFFEEPYLTEGKTYITSLIDYVQVDFHYKENFNQLSTGEASYYVVATVSADVDENGNNSYWSKDYNVTEPVIFKFDETDHAEFDISAKVNYQEFNDILDNFQKEYPVVSEGKLKISLVVSNTLNTEKFAQPLASTSEINLSLPLLKRAVDAKIDIDTGEKTHEFKTAMDEPLLAYVMMVDTGIVLVAAAAVLVIVVVVRDLEWKKHHLYIATRDRILDTNDSIITNISNLPEFGNSKIFKVDSFEELLDAYNELRLPINFYEKSKDKESCFFIMDQDRVWVYVLSKNKIERHK